MDREQMKKDIKELSKRNHVTQREMKVLIEVVGGLFECIESLESKIEDLNKYGVVAVEGEGE